MSQPAEPRRSTRLVALLGTLTFVGLAFVTPRVYPLFGFDMFSMPRANPVGRTLLVTEDDGAEHEVEDFSCYRCEGEVRFVTNAPTEACTGYIVSSKREMWRWRYILTHGAADTGCLAERPARLVRRIYTFASDGEDTVHDCPATACQVGEP